ncbi:hypothetical protein FSP39_011875 [Pinctada imbricata]|uniref:Phosphatidylserine Lipase ABHD16 N-terminal domain-containing protein n=1 Tax=Pinctada imbricata TaxID=66713 RepID=A0AA88XP26_PINIB|nr:hypothetical protein FSP39_011875 [Pinctada imbricata]
MLYRRGYFTTEGAVSIAKFATSIAIIYSVAYVSRGVGRWNNMDYLTFIGILSAAQRSLTQQNRRLLAQYDYDFWASPIDFKWSTINSGYLATHTFGRRMIYPGATALINTLVEPVLCQNRAKLVEERYGVRAKVQTEDRNEIDTMFIDRRQTGNQNGKTLVVCCEGNSGFYEIGCTDTPIQAGYSVLGWNHPGFAGSSGVPLPEQEQAAIDGVIQYAIHTLGFMPSDIALFAWSIGGYSATWAAMNYPDVKFVILDATFDDILPLAVIRMPQFVSKYKESPDVKFSLFTPISMETYNCIPIHINCTFTFNNSVFSGGLVEYTVRKYFNLNNAEQLCKYHGPILLVRRTMDEMITTEMDPATGVKLHTNRGNHLLCKLLSYRYPNIVNETSLVLLDDWLARVKSDQEILWTSTGVDEDLCLSMIKSYNAQHSDQFPSNIGETFTQEEKNKMTLYLASRYMEDFNSTHCNPLTPNYLRTPWTPNRHSQPRFISSTRSDDS